MKWTTLIILIFLAGYVGAITGGLYARRTATVVSGRTGHMTLYSLKGTIYDRELRPITNSQECYYLLIDPRSFDRGQQEYVSTLCAVEEEWLGNRLEREVAFLLTSNVKPKNLSGVYVFEGMDRYSDVAAHLVGYINSDLEGVSGLEKSYNDELSYFGGSKKIVFATDGRRNLMTGLGITVEGDDGNFTDGVITTLDLPLQQKLEEAMARHIEKGAAVVLDAQSGELLACASCPDFDADAVEQYLNGTQGELVNRALNEQTVGSVFKIIVAAAALEANLDDFTMNCGGSIIVGDLDFACPVEGGHGEMNLERAFARSCNGYFIALGQMLGTQSVMEMARRLGFGEQMEIADGLTASGGTLPDVTGHSAKQLANICIGQGDLMASPLQIARLLAVCGNGGFLLSPTCFQGFYVDGEVRSEQWLDYRTRVLQEDVAEALRQLCVATVENGTGSGAMPKVGGAGGKTSSAQTGIFDAAGREVLNTYFAGFYPAQAPCYAIAVFAQDGSSGGATCAPVFQEICNWISEEKD